MRISVQIVVDGHIFLQTMPAETEPCANSWKVKVDCKLPHRSFYECLVIRHGRLQDFRLIGWVQIRRDNALISGDQILVPFCLKLIKVNHDGPLLQVRAVFSLVESSIAEYCKVDGINRPEDQDLPHFLETRMMHERILLLFPRNKNRKILLNILGEITYRKWVHQRIENLNQAIAAHRDAVREDPDDAGSLVAFGSMLCDRFEQLGDVEDINDSVLALQKSATNSVDAARSFALNNLGQSLLRRFERFGALDDLDGSLSALGDSDDLTPSGHPDKHEILTRLGIVLMRRFERLGDLGDLAKSVSLGKEALCLTGDGHPDRPILLQQLGTSLLLQFQRLGDLDSLNSSISLLDEALHLTPHGHPNRWSNLANLDHALYIRFERLGDLADLHRSVLLGSQAVCISPEGHVSKASAFNNHGLSLLTRFERLGNLNDLDSSIEMCENAVRLTPDGHADRQLRLQNLGNSLSQRFQRLSISIRDDAVRLTPDDHPEKPARLQNLGHSLCLRFERFGDIEDLQRSAHPDKLDRLSALYHSVLLRFERLGDLADINHCIVLAENILELTPDGHPAKSRGSSRFEHIGDLGDLNRSVVQYYKALHLAPEGHCSKPSYLMRFEQLGDLDDLKQAILLYEDAIQLTPDGDIDKPACDRFKRLGDADDLKKFIQIAENTVRLISNGQVEKPAMLNNLSIALFASFRRFDNIDDLNRVPNLTPDNHPERQARLSNLAMCLLRRFEKLGDIRDLERSSQLGANAIRETPDGHPDRPAWLVNHSVSLQSRPGKNPEDLEEVINRLSSAAHSMTGPPHIQAHPSVLDAYRMSLDLLPVLAWLGLSIKDRHYHIVRARKVARNAATAAIAVGLPGVAVEWLEQGRSIIWGQLLNLRTPTSCLAEKFIFLSAQLEGTGIRGGETNATNSSTQAPNAQRSHDQALERNTLLEDIRRLEGFDRFLLPKAMSELSKAAQGGPVVILNLSDDRCDALALSPGTPDVIHIFLPEFTPEHAENLSRSLHGLVHNRGRNERLLGHREGHLDPEEAFALVLSELWTKLVKPVLNALNITTPRTHNFQRIWWCPTALGFVISSYTPSFRPRSQSQKRFQVLVVAQPSAQGQTYIPGTQAEITSIQRHATGKVPVLRLDVNMATVDNVQAGMRDSSWVHFACHGADFAFLSACQTATGDEVLQEEAVHLAGGILAAGYRGVIATMWTIMDSDAPQVASDVYEHLFQDSLPDSGRAAEALHFAIKRLREGSGNRKSFSHWVPFIHVGV
ncbi:TPR-like protein [Mycena leptocephala]|nr:TPR-like protein [Mycena leptocephala]